MNRRRFAVWVRRRLLHHLHRGDIDHGQPARPKTRQVRDLIESVGAAVRFLPPYSHDFNPIEGGWGLIKKRIRAVAPQTGTALRTTARRARHDVRPHHCQNWFVHAGYEPSDR